VSARWKDFAPYLDRFKPIDDKIRFPKIRTPKSSILMFRNNAVVQRIHMQPNESIGASFDGSFANTRTEGSGTRPDYLANCADKKIEGPLRKN